MRRSSGSGVSGLPKSIVDSTKWRCRGAMLMRSECGVCRTYLKTIRLVQFFEKVDICNKRLLRHFFGLRIRECCHVRGRALYYNSASKVHRRTN